MGQFLKFFIFFKGLGYMLKKKYFNDSFILHDESVHEIHLKTFFNYIEKENLSSESDHTENVYQNLKSFESSQKEDPRSFLHKKC